MSETRPCIRRFKYLSGGANFLCILHGPWHTDLFAEHLKVIPGAVVDAGKDNDDEIESMAHIAVVENRDEC
jgi:hypothetical protein